jgi:hypothetical protein
VPADQISAEVCKNIRFFFTDLDETISTEGKILPEAYNALWDLHRAGLVVVPITGRCAGWVDHIARFWPVDGVVGENGAFYFFMKNNKLAKRYYFDLQHAQDIKGELFTIRDEILTKYPDLAVASDQPYREFDLAIDFCEDVPRASWQVVDDIVAIFKSHGAQAKISSIHVNGWFGDFNKLQMARIFVQEQYGEDLDDPAAREAAIFIGDSPNDQPMFEFFPETVGVANIFQFWDRLQYKPKYVCSSLSGLGFAEFARIFLEKRAESL